jgi:hypothetical protein
MFLEPICAASYRGHVDIVKLIIIDDSDKAPHGLVCPTLIVNYFNDHTELLDLTLGLSWRRCEVEPHNTDKLRILAPSFTLNLETFKRLLEGAKPHIAMHDPKWLSRRTHDATTQGQADIVKYLIEEERVDVNEYHSVDTSIFLSRYSVEFLKGFMLRYRPATLLSVAARGCNRLEPSQCCVPRWNLGALSTFWELLEASRT